ncbi:ssrAB-activated protein [Enterobacteriaceae bacterium Kacie_13]|nr:ssrAB-activated protein [Enterobacteriaceae bacterium Kacie_13]
MAKIILRSGYLDDYIPLGENGQTLFDSAIQIRETLRLRKQQMILDCLAIPQRNDAEGKVDWYPPQEGVVTQWASASDQQREHALRYLENCFATAATLSQRCLQAEKTAVRLFGSLLTNVLQFPARQHVYLVDDKPVITFWGFVSLNQAPRDDAFDCLRQPAVPEVEVGMEEEEEAKPLPPAPEEPLHEEALKDPEPVIVTLSQPDAPLLAPVASAPAEPPAPQGTPTREAKNTPVWRSLLLKIMAVGMVFIVLPLAYPRIAPMLPALFEAPYHADAPATPPPVIPAPKIVLSNTLPVQPAQVVPLPATHREEESAEAAGSTTVEPEIDKNALVLPAEDVKAGTTAFMNGHWKASIDVNNPLTRKPPGLRYQIKNSEGTITIARDNNITCKADIYLGLMQSGNLLIKSRNKAKCSDDSRYQVPEITCRQPLSGAAQCTGRYADDTVVPMTLLKVGK